MKNLYIVILTILMVFSVSSAQLKTLVEKNIQFSTAGANTVIYGPYDISEYWESQKTAGTLVLGTDSAYVFKWVSMVWNSADSGSIAIDMGISNEQWLPSRGLVGTIKDSLAVPDSAGSYIKWFRAGDAVLCAADADTIVIHAANTADQTETVLPGRIATSSPKKYAYFRYITGAANTASNKARHVVLVDGVKKE